MRYAGAVVVTKRISQAHRVMQEVGGVEATASGREGGKGGDLKGVQHIWVHLIYGTVLQVPVELDIGGR